jgi:hypothetical protein
MGWVYRQQVDGHTCPTPELVGTRLGDLWRCDECPRLWRVGYACDRCEHVDGKPHGAGHAIGKAWRPATFWQRLRFPQRREVTP